MLPDLTASIIAGGLSERFGEHKTRVKIGNRELVDFAIQLAKSLTDQVIIVHGEKDDYADKNLPHFSDLVPHCGPMGGIYTALQQANTPFVATIPADVPLLTVKVYEVLFQEKNDTVPVVAASDRGMEPLIGIWPGQLKNELKAWIEKSNFSLREFLQEIGAQKVSIADRLSDYDPDWFININFQRDLNIFQKKLNLRT